MSSGFDATAFSNFFSAFVLYVLIWWMVFFTVLPWGNRPSSHITPGTAGSAPDQPRLPRKLLITTVIAAVLWLPLYPLFQYTLRDLRDQARQMALEDQEHE